MSDMQGTSVNREELVAQFRKAMQPIIAERLVTADGAEVLSTIYDEFLSEWEDYVVEVLNNRIEVWNRVMDGTPDDTLYTLGLRQAIDLVQGKNPFDLSTPVVQEEDEDVSTASD